MDKARKMFSLNRQIAVILSYVYILFVVIILSVLGYLISNYQKQQKDKNEEALSYYADTLDQAIADAKDIAREIYSNNTAFRELEYYADETTSFNQITSLFNDMKIMSSLINNLDGLWIFYDNQQRAMYKLNRNVSMEEKELIQMDCRSFLSSSEANYGEAIIPTGDHYYYLVYFRRNNISVAGMVDLSRGITLAKNVIPADAYGGSYEKSTYLINDTDYEFYPVLEKKDLAEGRNTVGEGIVYKKTLNNTTLSVLSMHHRSLWSYISPAHIWILLLLLLSIYPAVKVYHLIQMKLIIPLRDMTETMHQIQHGNWENFKIDSNVEEIEEVKKSIETMIVEILDWKNKTYEEKMEKQYAQLQYLQLQLRPHFYLNCLKIMNALMMSHKYDESQEYLIRVSVHFQYLLQNCMDFVTVKKEIEFIRNYIEMMGCGNQCEIRVEPEAEACLIPILSIQSFIENSIKYAKGSRREELAMEIQVSSLDTEDGNYINIVIRDNGKGYQEEILKELNQASTPERSEHVGIINLKKRMLLLYGEEAACYFENKNGAVSDLLLPYRKLEK